MKPSRNSKLITSLLLAAGLTLTGCSVTQAPAESSPGAGENSEVGAQGAALTQDNFAERIETAQFAAGSAHIAMSMGDALPGTVEADMIIDADPERAAMQMQMNAGGMVAEIRMTDGKMYMNMGQLTGGKFVDLAAVPGDVAELGSVLDQMNPGAQVAVFAAALTDFNAAAGPEIDGVATTQVTLTLDTRKMLEAQPNTVADIDAAVEALGAAITYDVFVGSDDLPRRIVMPNPAGAGTATLEYSKWGEPVSISAPAADEIADASSLL